MADTAEIETLLEDALPGAEVSVTDMQGGDHLYAHVKAPQFDGLSLIAQHKLVYAPVQHLIDDGTIHALKIKTEVPT
jgi:acid stress-induced BolA-like protein IbaG/YrbA